MEMTGTLALPFPKLSTPARLFSYSTMVGLVTSLGLLGLEAAIAALFVLWRKLLICSTQIPAFGDGYVLKPEVRVWYCVGL